VWAYEHWVFTLPIALVVSFTLAGIHIYQVWPRKSKNKVHPARRRRQKPQVASEPDQPTERSATSSPHQGQPPSQYAKPIPEYTKPEYHGASSHYSNPHIHPPTEYHPASGEYSKPAPPGDYSRPSPSGEYSRLPPPAEYHVPSGEYSRPAPQTEYNRPSLYGEVPPQPQYARVSDTYTRTQYGSARPLEEYQPQQNHYLPPNTDYTRAQYVQPPQMDYNRIPQPQYARVTQQYEQYEPKPQYHKPNSPTQYKFFPSPDDQV
jgi:hypothetical protein